MQEQREGTVTFLGRKD